jgi:hypothetical protein
MILRKDSANGSDDDPRGSAHKRPKGLPKWFDLKKYERAATLDAEGWNLQISVRQACYAHLCAMRAHEIYLQEWDDPVYKAIDSLRSNPIVVTNSPPFDHKAFSWCFAIPVGAVRSMTRLDLYSIDRRVRQRLTSKEIEKNHWLVTNESPAALALLRAEYLDVRVDEDCSGLSTLPIMIDLRFPNKVLSRHFNIYLDQLRRRKGGWPKVARKKTPNLKKWTEAGVLPCIDLLLWGKQQNLRIPDSLLAKALGLFNRLTRRQFAKRCGHWQRR